MKIIASAGETDAMTRKSVNPRACVSQDTPSSEVLEKSKCYGDSFGLPCPVLSAALTGTDQQMEPQPLALARALLRPAAIDVSLQQLGISTDIYDRKLPEKSDSTFFFSLVLL